MAHKFAFIGVGNIARAITKSMDLLEGKIKTAHEDIYLYDKNTAQTEAYSTQGYNICDSIESCIDQADFVFLCVKPQNYREVLEYIRDTRIPLSSKTFVSVAAGISTSQICDCLGCECAVIRTMPNTPMTIGRGVCAICQNEHVNPKHFERICRILSSGAELIVLDESKMNSIIGITGSSPAYVYKFIDALNDAAISEGLDDPRILEIICEVFIGSAMMVQKSNSDLKSLIKAVKSPNGTTERALNVFDDADISGIILKAVQECNRRADTLGDEM